MRQLVLLVLLAGLAEALLPRSELRRYAETVVGLLLLLAVLQPALGLVGSRFDWEATLGLPGPGAPDGSAAAERLRGVQRRLVLDAFRHRAAARVREVVEALPGVARARVGVRVADDPARPDYARIVEVEVAVTPEAAGTVEAASVRRAVRSELGLPADRVRVTVEESGPTGGDGFGRDGGETARDRGGVAGGE